MRYYAIKLSYGAEYGKGSIEKKNTEKERATVRGVKPEKTSAAGEGAESEKEYIIKESHSIYLPLIISALKTWTNPEESYRE